MNNRIAQAGMLALLVFLPAAPLAYAESHDEQLLAAASQGDLESVKSLLESGVPVDVRDQRDGTTPVIVASVGGHLEIVRLLLDNGASIDLKDEAGFTPLIWAAAQGHSEVVELLLNKGANPDLVDDQGKSALQWAEANNHQQVVALLKKPGEVDVASAGRPRGAPIENAPPSPEESEVEGPTGGPQAEVVGVDQPEGCLRVRSGPGASYEVVGCLSSGSLVTLSGTFDERNRWAEVVDPVQGWVFLGQIRGEGLPSPTPAAAREPSGQVESSEEVEPPFAGEDLRPTREVIIIRRVRPGIVLPLPIPKPIPAPAPRPF